MASGFRTVRLPMAGSSLRAWLRPWRCRGSRNPSKEQAGPRLTRDGALPFYASASSSTTGQWSLPVISGQMSAFFTRGRSRWDTMK